MTRQTVRIWVAALAVCCCGCGSDVATSEIRSTPAPATATTNESAAAQNDPNSAHAGQPVAASTPSVEILSWDQTQKRREQFKGKVVVLDVWSTWCDPCVREFPNLVELQSRFGDKVVCISFNTDYSGAKDEPPQSLRKPVLQFLTAKKARLFNVICSDPSEDFYNKIRLGGPPAVFVYDRKGSLVKRLDNSHVSKTNSEFTYKNDVVPLVERLLAGHE